MEASSVPFPTQKHGLRLPITVPDTRTSPATSSQITPPELANSHGVRQNSTPQFSYDYAKSVFESNISEEFLQQQSPFAE